jgi:hypothetical protein
MIKVELKAETECDYEWSSKDELTSQVTSYLQTTDNIKANQSSKFYDANVYLEHGDIKNEVKLEF